MYVESKIRFSLQKVTYFSTYYAHSLLHVLNLKVSCFNLFKILYKLTYINLYKLLYKLYFFNALVLNKAFF